LAISLCAATLAAGSTPDLVNGSNIVASRCFNCHSLIPPPAGASLQVITNFAYGGGGHGGGPGPFLEVNLEDLAAYISQWYFTNDPTKSYTVYGVVVDPSGQGIPNARVRATSTYLDLPPSAVTNTAADGGFALYGLPPGDLHVLVDTNGFTCVPDSVFLDYFTLAYGNAGNADFLALAPGSPPLDQLTIIPPPLHVRPDGNDLLSGKSWISARRTVQTALDASPAGGRVYLAAGLYHEQITVSGRELYGGFAGIEGDFNLRDPWLNPAILDGNPATPGTIVFLNDEGTNHARVEGLGIQNGMASWPNDIGGGICVRDGAAPAIVRCFLRQNHANYGGAIGCQAGAAPVITHNIFESNSAYNGGGIYSGASSTPPLIANNLFLANTSDSGGAAIHCETGAGLVVNNTLVGNAGADETVGVLYYLLGTGVTANNLVAFNSAGIEDEISGTELRNNCVFGNTNGNFLGISPSATDLTLDPLLVDYAGWNCHLRPSSPCVDAGDAPAAAGLTVDLDGHPRRARLTVDIGAYELPAPTLMAHADTNGLGLSWPVEETGFVLEVKTNLADAWQPWPSPYATNQSLRTVETPGLGSRAFFRLRK
jgi:hypothetical protein